MKKGLAKLFASPYNTQEKIFKDRYRETGKIAHIVRLCLA